MSERVPRNHEYVTGSGKASVTISDIQLSDSLKQIVGDSTPEPLVIPPQQDLDHVLASYFISSSHNTYIHKHQLYGKASEENYSDVIERGCACVEIDAWDNSDDDEIDDKVVVYHGYTAVGKLSFRSVCEAINNTITPDTLPVIISLENHTKQENQRYMAETMKEVFADKLITKVIPNTKFEGQLTPNEAKGKVLVATEYCHHTSHLTSDATTTTDPNEPRDSSNGKDDDDDSSSSSDESDDEEARDARKKRKETKFGMDPELSALGVYSNSIKPSKLKEGRPGFWEVPLFHPPKHMVNASESLLSKILPTHMQNVLAHSHEHLFRVYPKGLRISSKNLDPARFWRAGAQICALNWQTFDKGMQLNEALFCGSNGYVLKPEILRPNEIEASQQPKKGTVDLDFEIIGACNLPLPEDVKDGNLRPYVQIEIMTARKTFKDSTPVFQVGKSDEEQETRGRHPIWNYKTKFSFPVEELVFVRIQVWHKDHMFSRDDLSAQFTFNLDYSVGDGQARGIHLLSDSGDVVDAAMVVKLTRQIK